MASGELGVVEADKEEVVPFGTAIVESSEDTYGKTALHLDASAILIPSNLTNFTCVRLNLLGFHLSGPSGPTQMGFAKIIRSVDVFDIVV